MVLLARLAVDRSEHGKGPGAQLDELSRDFTVVAWDAPGVGGSSDPPEGHRHHRSAKRYGRSIADAFTAALLA